MRLRQAAGAVGVALRNALVGGNVASLAFLPRPRAWVNYVSEVLFLYKALKPARELPQRNVFEVVGRSEAEPIVLAGLRGETWMQPIASYTTDIVSLCLLCRLLRPKVVFEIGTLNGYTALHFAANSPDARVYTLDLPRGEVGVALETTMMDDAHIVDSQAIARCCFDGTPEAARITRLYGDSATFDYTPYAGTVDLFFVDGAHSYEYVRSDTLKALACCRPGSVIAWHDYGRAGVNGVSRWLGEFARQGNAVYSVPGGSVAFMVVEGGGDVIPAA